jgi:hypothetical protein
MMKLFGVIDFTQFKKDGRKGRFVGSYAGKRIMYREPWEDRDKFIHFEISEGQYPEGYHWLDGTGLTYDFDYTPPVDDAITKETALTYQKQQDGFALYQSMIGIVNAGGGMGSIDTGIAA